MLLGFPKSSLPPDGQKRILSILDDIETYLLKAREFLKEAHTIDDPSQLKKLSQLQIQANAMQAESAATLEAISHWIEHLQNE